MKIAIQGQPTRGKEVIQILESLGGRNNANLKGAFKKYYYFIDLNSTIDYTEYASKNIHTYTLEKFEKEFPFKVGDKVLLKGLNDLFEIIALEWYMNKLCYKLDNGLHYAPNTLTTYKEMKERNITLTLDKAKEWYKKGGELKEIALQAFTEQELNPLPRSWEEFCEKYPVKKGECFLEFNDGISVVSHCIAGNRVYKNWIPSKKSAEAHLAMIQLEQLRNCWWNGWEPEWNNCEKYVIKCDKDDFIIFTAGRIHAFLVFPTRHMAEEFLECFRDLIEKAGDLI